MLSDDASIRKHRQAHQRGKHYIWCVASGKSTTYSVCPEGGAALGCAVKPSLTQGQAGPKPGSVVTNENRGFQSAKPSAARLGARFARQWPMKSEKNCLSARSGDTLSPSIWAEVSIEIIFQSSNPRCARAVISRQHPRANPYLPGPTPAGHWRGPPVPSQTQHPGQPCGLARCAHDRP